MFWLEGTKGNRIFQFLTKQMHTTYWRMRKIVDNGQMVTHQNTD